MRKVRGRDTAPEMIVRRFLHGKGYRFRIHTGDIPGRPDIVFRGRRKAIFVHGCFWHRHEGCKRTTTPKTRRKFWEDKFSANQKRDANVVSSLRHEGWEVIVVWECETEDIDKLGRRLVSFLGGNRIPGATPMGAE